MAFELTPYERKKEWYSNVALGVDTKTQIERISNQTKVMIEAQFETANAIITSQDRIKEGTDNISYLLEDVREGIYGLKAAFDFGISEVVWQIEQNRLMLKSILEVLMAPLDTQAKELRRRAEEAYANGWFDEALDDFLESEKKNKYDFIVHISIGMICLFQKGDREKALEYFEKAVKYAKPKSKYHASFALLYMALIKRDMDLLKDAEKLSAEAVDLSPEFAEALYQNALYNALVDLSGKFIPNLYKAMELDVNYCEKASNDSAFPKSILNVMFENLRDKEKKTCLQQYGGLNSKQDKYNSIVSEILNKGISVTRDGEVISCFERVDTLIKRNSYRDYLEANKILFDLKYKQTKQFSSLVSLLQDQVIIHESSSSSSNKIAEDKMRLWLRRGYYSLIPALSALIGGSVHGGIQKALVLSLIFAIPYLGHLGLFAGLIYYFINSQPDYMDRMLFSSSICSILVAFIYILTIKYLFTQSISESKTHLDKNTQIYKESIEKLNALIPLVAQSNNTAEGFFR